MRREQPDLAGRRADRNGESDVLMVSIPGETLTSFAAPEPMSPAKHAVLSTVTPVLEYQLPVDTDSVSVMLKEVSAMQGKWYPADTSGRFQVPEGLLKHGQEYKWMVSALRSQPVGPTLKGISEDRFFAVEGVQEKR